MKSTMVAACALAVILGCGEGHAPQTSLEHVNSVAITNLDSFYLAQLETHRVLLLGEGRHHNDHVADRAVVSLLSFWLDQIASGVDTPLKLTLALEYPGAVGEQLRAYFATGDVAHFGLELQGRTISTLLFFRSLRDVLARADAMSSTHGVDLQILCPEHDYALSMDAEQRRHLAYTERDNRTAATVRSYLEANPDRMFVAYYGAGHLARRPNPVAETTPWGVQVGEQGFDVHTIVLMGFETARHPLPMDRMPTDFALTSRALAELVPGYSQRFDAEVYYRQPYFHTLRLKDVPSRLVVSRALDYAADMPQLAPAIASLWHRLTGGFVPEGGDVAMHVRDHLKDLDAIAAIDDLVLLKRVLASLAARNAARAEIDRVMFELTCFENVLDHKPYPVPGGGSAIELWTRVMADYHTPITASLYVAVLMYGTADEQAEAKAQLRRLSGQDFVEPEQWFEYSRQLWVSAAT